MFDAVCTSFVLVVLFYGVNRGEDSNFKLEKTSISEIQK